MNFGRSNTEIGRKMADGRLLFLALEISLTLIYCMPVRMYICVLGCLFCMYTPIYLQ